MGGGGVLVVDRKGDSVRRGGGRGDRGQVAGVGWGRGDDGGKLGLFARENDNVLVDCETILWIRVLRVCSLEFTQRGLRKREREWCEEEKMNARGGKWSLIEVHKGTCRCLIEISSSFLSRSWSEGSVIVRALAFRKLEGADAPGRRVLG